MALPSSSSSSSNIPKKRYHVFISFRGEDTRYKFTGNLHAALRKETISTYLDEEHLNRGEEITSGLLKGIEESQLAVIVFSKNYASSSFCLDELAHILKCYSNDGHRVIPVFYEVDPSDVRKQNGSYKEAFDKHQVRYQDKVKNWWSTLFNKAASLWGFPSDKHDPDKVKNWRSALVMAANLSGFHSDDYRYEIELVNAIVKDLINKLLGVSTCYVDSGSLVETKKPLKEIESLLQLERLDTVRVIGLWGAGGIGKTTVARILFCNLRRKFDGCCFVENVREKCEKRECYHIVNELVSTLLGEYNPNTISTFEITQFEKTRVQSTKSLIVLDDVNNIEQLDYLVGYKNWLPNGSRIIVTSRDNDCLSHHFVDDRYQVKGLNPDEARQLFCKRALKNSSQEIIESVVEYAEGNPLVLKQLRLIYESKSYESWTDLLKALKTSAAGEKRIQNVLMLSYNYLSKRQKSVFLDIACFFKGWHRQKVERILYDPDLPEGSSTINDLVDRSLITISYWDEKLCMHDLIQDMGHTVVQNSGESTRLCEAGKNLHFLKSMVPREVEGISFDVTKSKEVQLESEVFKYLHKLRVLRIYGHDWEKSCKVHLPNGLSSLPDELRYLEWEAYPAKSLPSSFDSEKLVELIITRSKVEQLWDGVQTLGSLRNIDLSHSKNLIEVPDLSQAPKLEIVNFEHCTSLLEVPSNRLQNLNRLVTLKMRGCVKLQSLPDRMETVETLDLAYCGNLKSIPEIKIKENVLSLYLQGAGIEELPASMVSFKNLVELDFFCCKNLKNIPRTIHRILILVGCLDLQGCSSFKKIPESLPMTLKRIIMSKTAIEEVPASIDLLSHLKFFDLSYCQRLRTLPTTICKLKSLEKLILKGCKKLENFPEIREPMKKLTFLDLSETTITSLPTSIENLVALERLLLVFCEKLQLVPSNIFKLESLRHLSLSDISQPFQVGSFPNLEELYLLDCNVSEVHGNCTSLFESVKKLDIIVDNDLDGMALSVAEFSNLETLRIWNWKKLRLLSEFPCNLRLFRPVGCTSLESVMSSRNAIMQNYSGRLPRLDFNEELFLFVECLKLTKNARNNIIADGQLRIFLSAMLDWHQSIEVITWPKNKKPKDLIICYPGNEIPEWFFYQATGSSIAIELSPDWWNTHFLGFSICLVLSFDEKVYGSLDLSFNIEFEFKTRSGETHKNLEQLYLKDYTASERGESIISSDHVLMSYKYFEFGKIFGEARDSITEVSIHFCRHRWFDALWSKVKQCGIRPLHFQDAEELGIHIPDYYWKPTLLESRSMNKLNTYCRPYYWNAIVFHDHNTETEEAQLNLKNNDENVGVKRYYLTLKRVELPESIVTYLEVEHGRCDIPLSLGESSASNIPLLYQIQMSLWNDRQTFRFGFAFTRKVPTFQLPWDHLKPSSSTQSASLDSTLQPENMNEDDLQDVAHDEASSWSDSSSTEDMNEDDLQDVAHDESLSWVMLKDLPKFTDNNSDKQSRRRMESGNNYSSDDHTIGSPVVASPGVSQFSINLEDDDSHGSSSQRPMGVKKAKLKKKINDEMAAEIKKIREANERLEKRLESASQHRQRVENMLERKEDRKILSMNLDTITDPESREYFRAKRNKILQKHRAEEQQEQQQQQPPPPPPETPYASNDFTPIFY